MSRPQPPDHVPVLIAGGGPVGLATAIELSEHGVASIVVEPRAEVSWLRPRAKTTSARSMEHFRRWNIAEAIRRQAPMPQAWSHEAVFCTTLLGREVTRIDDCFGLDLVADDRAAEGGQQVPQPLVEQVMRQRVADRPDSRLLTGWSVRSLSQNADGVVTTIEDGAGQVRTIHSTYVVGCDGARSIVRESVGVSLDGGVDSRPNFNIVFRSAALGDRVPHGPAVHYWVLNPDQPGVVGRLDLTDTWWCIAIGVDAERGQADPVSLVRNLLGEPGADLPIEVIATDPWRARMQLADRYAAGRVFLAGDAAHQNPPWGGHGFNTGIGDAVNLGWKLAAVLNGWAPESLLASYDAERRPVAAETIAVASANMATLAPELSDPRLIGSADEFAAVRPAVAAAVQRAKSGEFHSLDLVLGTAYAGSPVVAAEPGSARSSPARSTTGLGPYRPSAAPGQRLPHAWLGPGQSLFDRLGPEFSLVGDLTAPGAGTLIAAAERLGLPLTPVDLPRADCDRLLEARLVLVRPDQHVAWRGAEPPDPEGLLRQVVGHRAEQVPIGVG